MSACDYGVKIELRTFLAQFRAILKNSLQAKLLNDSHSAQYSFAENRNLGVKPQTDRNSAECSFEMAFFLHYA